MIDTLLSSALNDPEISHENLLTLLLKQIFMKILKNLRQSRVKKKNQQHYKKYLKSS